MKKMRIIIGTDGQTRVKVEGAVGSECLDFTRAFEEAIGGVVKRELTEAFHEEALEKIEEKVGQTL